MDPLRVIFVDDERSLLDGLRRSLHRKVRDWDLTFIDNGPDALKEMEEESYNVIISDMRMPGMNGVELLTEVKSRFPKMVRFVLSGFLDRDMILKSVGLTHQFFAKPCDPEQLIQAIQFSTSLYNHLNSGMVQQVICDITNLPTPPIIYTEMTRELNSPEPSIEKLSDLVMQDSAMSARVLQMVNSAFFGIGRPISDIAQAMMFLGIDNLRSLVLVLGIQNETFANLKSSFDLDLYTHHSVEVGTISQQIAKDLGWKLSDTQTAFTAGLLHDMGKLVMATRFEADYWKNNEFSMHTPDTIKIQELEDQLFGVNHSQIGAALLAIWGIPPGVVNAVAYHHTPQNDTVEGLSFCTIVHIANAIAYFRKEATDGDIDYSRLLNMEYLQSLGIESQIEQWMNSPIS